MKTTRWLIIGSLLALTAIFTWLDASVWMARFGSGADGGSPESMHAYVAWSEGLRFARTVGAGLLLVGVGHLILNRTDHPLLSLAFLLIIVADFFLILRGQLLVGIGVFALVQIVFVWRHVRGWKEAWMTWDLLVRAQKRKHLLGIGALGAVLWAGSFIMLGPRLAQAGLLVPTLIYGLLIVLALCSGWGVLVMQTMPSRNAWLLAIGMTLFTLCDITVGMGAALQGQPIGEGARVVTGLFYSPALILLALSGQRRLAK